MRCCHADFALTEGSDRGFTVGMPTFTFGAGVLAEAGDNARELGMKRVALFTDPLVAASPYVAGEYLPGAEATTDDEILAFARNKGATIFHPAGTCRMGPASDPLSVVDAALRVHGVPRLRVVDCSVMPTIVSGNTNAPVIMIAEKASDMILRDAR